MEPENVLHITSLSDLLETYPDIDDETFAGEIAAKYEFSSLVTDQPPAPGRNYPHQDILLRIFSRHTPYKECMVIWRTGSGKTRAILQILASFVDYPQKFGTFENDQRVLVIARASVISVWPDEMAQMPEYATKALREGAEFNTSSSKRSAITKAVKRYADIKKLDKFANELELMSDDAIVSKYSRAAIIIDEAHVLRTTIEPKYDEKGIIRDLEGPGRENKKAYVQIRRLMQLVKGCIKIILTATPMPDKPEELVSIASLILPEDKQMNLTDFKNAFNANDGGQQLKEYLEYHLRGRVSYVKPKLGSVPFLKQGVKLSRNVDGHIVETKFQIVNCVMSEEQTRVYKKHEGNEVNDVVEGEFFGEGELEEIDEENEKGEAFYRESRRAANYVIFSWTNVPPPKHRNDTASEFEHFVDPQNPDASRPNGVFEVTPPLHKTAAEREATKQRKVQEKREREQAKLEADLNNAKYIRPPSSHVNEVHTFKFFWNYNQQLPTLGLEPRPNKLQFGQALPKHRLELIRRMSAKAYFIICHVHNQNNIVRGRGQPYNPKEGWTFEGEGEVTFVYHSLVRAGGCIPLGVMFEYVGYDRYEGTDDIFSVSQLADKPRYAYMTGFPGSTDGRNKNIKDVLNTFENRFGAKIIVNIASDVASTGLSFVNFRKFIHLGPSFRMYRQARGRTVRLDSHQMFSRADQKWVKTYFLAAMTYNNNQTIDHKIWFDIVQKEQRIRIPERILKQIAFDCSLNTLQGNQCIGSSVDVYGSPLPRIPTDFSTYHLHWAAREFDIIDNNMRKLFKVKSSFTLDEIIVLLNNHNPQTIVWALVAMLGRREVFLDRLGYSKILRENKGIYYLSDVMPAVRILGGSREKELLAPDTHNALSVYYERTTVINNNEQFMQVSRNTIRENSQMFDNFDDFRERWLITTAPLGFAGQVKAELLERALLRKKLSQYEEVNQAISYFILEEFDPCWMMINGCIFHYYEAMRPHSTQGKYHANRNSLPDDAVIRVVCQGESDFKRAGSIIMAPFISAVNTKWSGDIVRIFQKFSRYIGQDHPSRIEMIFIGIWNRGADSGFRINTLSVKMRKGGIAIDKRGSKGRSYTTTDEGIFIDCLFALGIENTITVDFDRRLLNNVDRLRERVIALFAGSKIRNHNIYDWPVERLKFYYKWMPEHLSGRAINAVERYGDDDVYAMRHFVQMTDNTAKAHWAREIFFHIKRLGLLQIK
jgi:hypothetical protein